MCFSPVLVNVITLPKCTFLSLKLPFSVTMPGLVCVYKEKIEPTPKHELIVDCDIIRMSLYWPGGWAAKSSTSCLGKVQFMLILSHYLPS